MLLYLNKTGQFKQRTYYKKEPQNNVKKLYFRNINYFYKPTVNKS